MNPTIHTIGIAGSGAMGSGIAQTAILAGQQTIVYDTNQRQLSMSREKISNQIDVLVQKGKINSDKAAHAIGLLKFTDDASALSSCDLVIEAIVEDLSAKQQLFAGIEQSVSASALLATNTSSLSVAQLSSGLKKPDRFLGLHFFNPAHIMPLVEVIPGIHTLDAHVKTSIELMRKWGKMPVVAKDTPGFIVNRIARPYYSEAIRILEEGIATMDSIDWTMKHFGGFKMGPFELMDFIGHDVNYRVTESIWLQTFHEARYKPSISQKRLFEAGLYGKKSGRGFYDYSEGSTSVLPEMNEEKGKPVFERILFMLINEAAEACYYGVASQADIETAMTKGVNYPMGLLQWANKIGIERVVAGIDELFELYHEERYRCSVLLRKMAINGTLFEC
jgi:3-hydroxybutyryl-CoA dehydrogenase